MDWFTHLSGTDQLWVIIDGFITGSLILFYIGFCFGLGLKAAGLRK